VTTPSTAGRKTSVTSAIRNQRSGAGQAATGMSIF
jgi:hypothetical protein